MEAIKVYFYYKISTSPLRQPGTHLIGLAMLLWNDQNIYHLAWYCFLNRFLWLFI